MTEGSDQKNWSQRQSYCFANSIRVVLTEKQKQQHHWGSHWNHSSSCQIAPGPCPHGIGRIPDKGTPNAKMSERMKCDSQMLQAQTEWHQEAGHSIKVINTDLNHGFQWGLKWVRILGTETNKKCTKTSNSKSHAWQEIDSLAADRIATLRCHFLPR